MTKGAIAAVIAMTAAQLTGGCSGDGAQPEAAGGLQEYLQWARTRVIETSLLLDEIEAHALAANGDPDLQYEQAWYDRMNQLSNAAAASAGAMTAREDVPSEAQAIHADLLQMAGAVNVQLTNMATAMNERQDHRIPTAISAAMEFKRIEPRVLRAIKDLADQQGIQLE